MLGPQWKELRKKKPNSLIYPSIWNNFRVILLSENYQRWKRYTQCNCIYSGIQKTQAESELQVRGHRWPREGEMVEGVLFYFLLLWERVRFIYSLQPIIQGHQDRHTRKYFKAGTEVEILEEHCSLACSHGLFSYLFIHPGLQWTGPSVSIINQGYAPQTWPQVSRKEAVLRLRFPLRRHVTLTTEKPS